jgi:acyl-[acyl-carrier-protein]-phospholipid O-acyltransferase/long-chain-fatty-acid--[acyl-carrier-protein] ligase
VTSAYFWFLAALAQVNVYLLATTALHISQEAVGPLLAALAFGVAVGSVVAGIWSAGKIEPGLTPIGAAGLVATSVMMFVVASPASSGSRNEYFWSCFYLFLMGVSSGLFDVPLQSYLQYTARKHAVVPYSPPQISSRFLLCWWPRLSSG